MQVWQGRRHPPVQMTLLKEALSRRRVHWHPRGWLVSSLGWRVLILKQETALAHRQQKAGTTDSMRVDMVQPYICLHRVCLGASVSSYHTYNPWDTSRNAISQKFPEFQKFRSSRNPVQNSQISLFYCSISWELKKMPKDMLCFTTLWWLGSPLGLWGIPM